MSDIGSAAIAVAGDNESPVLPAAALAKNALTDGPILRTVSVGHMPG